MLMSWYGVSSGKASPLYSFSYPNDIHKRQFWSRISTDDISQKDFISPSFFISSGKVKW